MESVTQFPWPLAETIDTINGEEYSRDAGSVALESSSPSTILSDFFGSQGQIDQAFHCYGPSDPVFNFQMPPLRNPTPPEDNGTPLDAVDGYGRSPKRTCATDEKQRARNRQSQRAFRERKDAHVKDLERQIATMTKETKRLETSNAELKSECGRLRALVKLLMGDESNGDAEDVDDKDSRRAIRLKNLLRILDGCE